MTKDVISLSISVLLLFRHYISHKITFGAPSSGGVLCSARGAFIILITMSVPLRVWCISPIFFEVGIPNLICGCILGWRSVEYHFRVTVTLTSDLVFRIIVSGAYLLYYLR